MDKRELAKSGFMSVIIDGKKGFKEIESIEVSQNPFIPNIENPKLFIDEKAYRTIDGKVIIIEGLPH